MCIESDIDPSQVLKVVPIVVLIILLAVLFTTSWFTVDPQEQGVILRFGKHYKTVGPGLHFKLPFRLDDVYKVPVRNQLKQEFGYRTTRPGVRTQYSQGEFNDESIMLTGDLNVANVEWETKYRINDPFNFLFKVRNLEQTFRDMNEAVMREVVGDRTINEILTTGRTEIAARAHEELQECCDQYEMGILVSEVILQNVNPPERVKPAFNEVNQAQQEKERMINQAQQEYNKVIPRAKGDAQKTIEEAEGYAVERTNRAKGEANRFNVLFGAYSKSPEVTRRRLYVETMETVLGQVGRKIITDEQASGYLPLLNLNQEANQR
jgi:membrane protease subunit HflK